MTMACSYPALYKSLNGIIFLTYLINSGSDGLNLYSQNMTQIIVSVMPAQEQIYSSFLIRPCSTGTALRPSYQHAWYGPECPERLGSICRDEMF